MSSRRHSFIPAPSAEVHYEGQKSFWKTRTNLEILIVSYPQFLCLEIITYDAEKGIEPERIYVSSTALVPKINQEELKTKVDEKKEAILRQKKNVNLSQVTKEVLVQLMNQYIIQRMRIEKAEVTCTALKVYLEAIDGDSTDPSTGKLDILCDKPTGMTVIATCFQKKISSSDITSAINGLASESAELKKATRLAELATSSVDGFKLMLAEKMRLENEMKRKYSPARLRWIRAINRVLVQNYVKKVKIRLGIEDEDEEDEPNTPRSHMQKIHPFLSPLRTDTGKPKLLRRSIDNSLLDQNRSKLPAIGKSHSGSPTYYGSPGQVQSLPSISPQHNSPHEHSTTEKRKRRIDAKSSTSRRSFHLELLPSHQERSSFSREPSEVSLACLSGEGKTKVPSLLQSYGDISRRPVTTLVVDDPGTFRLVRI